MMSASPLRFRRLGMAVCVVVIPTLAVAADAANESVQLLKTLCTKCHGQETQKAGFALHDIDPDIASGADVDRWERILEMVSIGDMPPDDEQQPTAEQRERLIAWLTQELSSIGRGPVAGSEALPENGNRVNHEALFSGEYTGPAFTRSRLWRISPQIYRRFAASIDMARKLNAPLQVAGSEGIRDYSLLYADEATILTMLQNCKRAAATLLHGRVDTKTNRSSTTEVRQGGRRGSRYLAFAEFLQSDDEPDAAELNAVLDYSIRLLLRRPATDDDRARYVDGFLKPNVALAGREAGLTGMLTTVMMSPEFLFRMELGLGEELPDGRRMLAPREIAYALSFAVFDYVEPKVLQAAEDGRLSTKNDVAREFRRMLTERDRMVRGPANARFWVVGKGAGITDEKLMEVTYPRLLRFFREFFGYVKAPDVFKDDSRHDEKHKPFDLVMDADWFVLRALKDDRHVLRQLLTSDRYFVQSRSRKPIREARPYNIDGPRDRDVKVFEPIAMTSGQRAGMLTHPAWLAAHSGNFENDPVRRGKWIREHLLAGVVPDIPIGVAAMLPEEPHRTLRQRFEVVAVEECWRCHKKMNPLGNPFEAYDDFGRFRTHHLVGADGNVVASEFEAYSRLRKVQWRDSHKKGSSPEEFDSIPVDTTGVLNGTGDPQLDGEISGPVDLMQRLAQSDRVRQSFVRHVFRYWMGRNETLNDSPTLMAMDTAYIESDGSFQELLVALVTSDSFLYRK